MTGAETLFVGYASISMMTLWVLLAFGLTQSVYQ